MACQAPPRAVAIPRALKAAATARNVFAPALCASLMTGRTFAALRDHGAKAIEVSPSRSVYIGANAHHHWYPCGSIGRTRGGFGSTAAALGLGGLAYWTMSHGI
jgi:hypothetical protein